MRLATHPAPLTLFLTMALTAFCLYATPTVWAQTVTVLSGHYDNDPYAGYSGYEGFYLVPAGATFNNNGSYGLLPQNSNVTVVGGTFIKNGGFGLFAYDYVFNHTSDYIATVSGGTFNDNALVGLEADGPIAIISGGIFNNNGQYGLAANYATATISGGTFNNNGDTGLSFLDAYLATVSGGTFNNNGNAGLSANSSTVTISGGTFSNNSIGLEAYASDSTVTVSGGQFRGNQSDFSADNGTIVLVGVFDQSGILTGTGSFAGRLENETKSQTFTYSTAGQGKIILSPSVTIASARMVSSHVLEIKTNRYFGTKSYDVQIKATINGSPVTASQPLSSDVDTSGNVNDTNPFDIDLAAQKVPRFQKNQKFTVEADVLDSGDTNIATDKKDAVILLPVVLVPGIQPLFDHLMGGDGSFPGVEDYFKQHSATLLSSEKVLGDGYSLIGDQTNSEFSYPTLYTLSYDLNNATFAQGADALTTLCLDIKERTWAESIDIVSHSKGGLVARKFIVTSPQPLGVHHLFLCTTPNLGSEVAKLGALRYHANWQNLYPTYKWFRFTSLNNYFATANVELNTLNQQALPQGSQGPLYTILHSQILPTPTAYTVAGNSSNAGSEVGDIVVPDFSQLGLNYDANNPGAAQTLIPAFSGVNMEKIEIDHLHNGYLENDDVESVIFGELTSGV